MKKFDCIGQQVKSHRCEFSIRVSDLYQGRVRDERREKEREREMPQLP